MKTSQKVLSSVAGSMLLFSGAGAALANLQPNVAQADESTEPTGTVHEAGEYAIAAAWNDALSGDYTKVANVDGTFSFNQLGTTPNDELFNMFGTAVLSMCSKPAPELVDEGQGVANFYVNVSGHMTKSFSVNVADLDDEQGVLMGCSCMTGSPLGQAYVVGVPLASVVEMADLEDGVNTVTAYGADGFGQPLPLRYALDKNALLVYQVNGQELRSETDSSLQLWMPETVANYFTRNIVEIQLTHEDAEPDVQQVDPCYRNKINITNDADGCAFAAGDHITFEGVADDLGSPVVAVEFSFDGGSTWTSCETEGATADKWVNWSFTTSFEEAGEYQMIARAKTADGVVSPLTASLDFSVK
ncbi:molybdopterin-dependent oxidoreductase [Eggerthella sinensis]|uniref:molybdopterin-dependent oxidoreductase n=1 Tax=Eggerthella sinensis TaxID=242230 RepID=UPI0022E09804|nr:molybdopterin-dependent oxidoreductase [Eggerthella sinensis]